MLVVLDDAQWLDRASPEAVSFAARRLEGEPVTPLVAARSCGDLPGVDHRLSTLTLGALDDAGAGRLLDLQPMSPSGPTKTRIPDQAARDPPALVELTRSAATQGAATSPLAAGPLPLADHLERLFAARLTGLPARTRRGLLLAAMDSVGSATAVPAVLAEADDGAWLPAEQAGLVREPIRTSDSDTRWSGPPFITPRPSTIGARLTARSPNCRGTNRTGVPGTWLPPVRDRTPPCRPGWS